MTSRARRLACLAVTRLERYTRDDSSHEAGMADPRDRLRAELKSLVDDGNVLLFALLNELGMLTAREKTTFADAGRKLPSFREGYERWYTVSRRLIAQVLPERLDEFVRQHEAGRRKALTYETYGIADYLLGLRVTKFGDTVVDEKAALNKFRRQVGILESVDAVFDSAVANLVDMVQAQLFDSELDAAKALNANGFARAAGALAGVVLERHLHAVCATHGLTSRKSKPTINDWNELLKSAEVIETPTWRFIQHLADVRNLCDHARSKEPSAEEVSELLLGVGKITKTVL